MKHFPRNLPTWVLALSLLTLFLTGCNKTEVAPVSPQPAAEEIKAPADPTNESSGNSQVEPKADDPATPISDPAPASDQPVDVPDPSGG